MPGVTIRLTAQAAPEDADRFASAQTTMLYESDYERVDVGKAPLSMGYVAYPAYPLRWLGDDPNIVQLVEGRIYNKSWVQIERELASLARGIRSNATPASDAIRPWMIDADGEYVVVMAFPAEKRLVVFTDPLGGLPLYYYSDEDQLLLARECKFILHLKPPPVYDRVGCAQQLWAGYPLGDRTPFHDVKRAPAGALIDARGDGETVMSNVSSLITLNFDQKDDALNDSRKAVDCLVDRFVEACRLRGMHAEGGANILGLSGGHDSRAVLAGMVKTGVSCTAVTGQRRGQPKHEVSGAQAVAAALGVPWQCYQDSAVNLALHEELVRIKDGLNSTAVSVGVANGKRVRSTWGSNATYLTGDGGDKALPDLRPTHSVRSDAALLHELDQRVSWFLFPSDLAAALLGLPSDALLAELAAVIATYPEASRFQKFVHYMIYERGRRFVIEGEDRMRHFAWSTTPFFAFPFLETSMRVPDRFKTNRALYRDFLIRLSPMAAQIPLTGVGVGATASSYLWRTWIRGRYEGLPWPVRRWLKAKTTRTRAVMRPQPEIAAALESAMDATDGLSVFMDVERLRRFLPQATPGQFHHILTLALLTRRYTAP